jgi:hypothetical protein
MVGFSLAVPGSASGNNSIFLILQTGQIYSRDLESVSPSKSHYKTDMFLRSSGVKSTPPIAPLAIINSVLQISNLLLVKTQSIPSKRSALTVNLHSAWSPYIPKKDSTTPHGDYLYSNKSPSQPSGYQPAKTGSATYLKSPINMTKSKTRWFKRILRR